jgi:hypothetical protein
MMPEAFHFGWPFPSAQTENNILQLLRAAGLCAIDLGGQFTVAPALPENATDRNPISVVQRPIPKSPT